MWTNVPQDLTIVIQMLIVLTSMGHICVHAKADILVMEWTAKVRDVYVKMPQGVIIIVWWFFTLLSTVRPGVRPGWMCHRNFKFLALAIIRRWTNQEGWTPAGNPKSFSLRMQNMWSLFFSDINECHQGLHNCHSDAGCANTQGSYHCTCNSGYTGNGTNCDGTCEWSVKWK